MTVARIEIDFVLKDGEDLETLLFQVGDLIVPVLDPHGPDEECSRWVSVEAYEFTEEDYDVSFVPDEEDDDDEDMGEVLTCSIKGLPQNFRANSEFN